ncbi:o-succinylbenzoate synthase [Actinomycetospora sp. TBRC 11914]|uniref:o-succinylbenzoate synthase n=1 Tax=Actinomycetospora sp. TBRC 11914 TaxID=2729387 RepID=UPI00145D3584|nr:o-succinylbenzoate synthase [Actinomycetospora sp. TBRC 11914]NMO88768.1 o-succinylbenzoate synthase [Actinomycetospora sp. TBRC 11914]
MAVVALPMRTRFRGITVRETLLLRRADDLGDTAAPWGEFCPFTEYDDDEAVPWLRCALESAGLLGAPWPAPRRASVPVNATVPAVGPAQAHRIVVASGAGTAKVKVAERGQDPAEDLARVEAVRDALGPAGRVRVDANAGWDVDAAVAAITTLDRAAGGLEYVEQPCPTVEELAAVRRRVDVPVAADESIRRAGDPMRVVAAQAADVAVVKVAPLGGIAASLRIAEAIGLPCVVSSAVESSVGLAAGLALAGALPELPHACGLATTSLLAADTVAPGDAVVPVGGAIAVPTAPPPVPVAALAEHAASPDRASWWLDRLRRVLRRVDDGVPTDPGAVDAVR